MSVLNHIYPLPVKYNNYNYLQWLYLNKHNASVTYHAAAVRSPYGFVVYGL